MTTPLWISVVAWATKLVLVLLTFLSVWSFSIIFDRRKALKKLSEQESEFKKIEAAIETGKLNTQFSNISLSQELLFLIKSLTKSPQNRDSIESGFSSAIKIQRISWNTGLPILATLGSNAPFIGLFGTVLGIIQAFGTMAQNQSSMNLVIASLAEALIATAVGLFVAIPAVSAYNIFQNKIRVMTSRLESIKDLYCSKLI